MSRLRKRFLSTALAVSMLLGNLWGLAPPGSQGVPMAHAEQIPAISGETSGSNSTDMTIEGGPSIEPPAAAADNVTDSVYTGTPPQAVAPAVYGSPMPVVMNVYGNQLPGLIAHWDFEQITNGKVADVSGNNHTATVYNTTLTNLGRNSKGMYFNGTNAFLSGGPASSYDLRTGFSVTMWVQPEAQSNGIHKFISWDDGFRTSGNGFEMGLAASGTRFSFMLKNEVTREVVNTYHPITTMFGRWKHMAMTWDPDSKTMKIYQDGQFAGQATFAGPLLYPNRDLWIGKNNENYFHKGIMDEVKVYNRALSAAEIMQDYQDLPSIPVTGITLSQTALNLPQGATAQVTYTIEPYHAKDLGVTWLNSNPAVATVDEFGRITAISEGTTVLTVQTRDGGHTARCTVQVYVQHPTGVSLNKSSTTIEEYRTERLYTTVTPSNASNHALVWSSSNPAVATVDEVGVVRGLMAGQTTITAITVVGGYSASAQVTVRKTAITGLALSKSATAILAGGTETLSATVSPSTATHKERLSWSSSNEAVATVDAAGLVIARGAGQAIITVKADDGGMTASSTVTVPSFGQGIWGKVIVLRDYLNIYDFPEELIQYPLVFPAGTVMKNHLKLTTAAGQETPYELTEMTEDNQGYLTAATIRFRANLPKGTIKAFLLDYDPGYDYSAAFSPVITVQQQPDGSAVLSANQQQIKVPAGTSTYEGGLALSETSAPIIAVSRDGQNWAGLGSFHGPAAVKTTSISGAVVEHSLLSLTYEITYTFTGGRQYKVRLTLRHNDKHVTVDETLSGFEPGDETYFKFSMMNGINPDGRLVMSNGGYISNYSGKYDEKLAAGGKLPYELGLYAVNNYGVMRSTVFWKDSGANALIFSLYRNREWQSSQRFFYQSPGPQNLNFYSSDVDKYMQMRLEGTERHWALGLIPRSEVTVTGRTATHAGKTWLANSSMTDYENKWGAGPEVRLWQKLSDFSLDRYKNLVLDWTENPELALDLPGSERNMSGNETVTYASWLAFQLNYKFNPLVERYLDASLPQRNDRTFLEEYANSRWSWTPAQRQQARALIAFNAYNSAEDTNFPHTSMISGHANFTIDGKQALGITVGVFPEHPAAPVWKNEFMTYYNEWLSIFVRRPRPEFNAKGGRWYENPTTYSLASLRPSLMAYWGLKQYDGTDLFDHSKFRDWMRWNINIMVPAEGGIRMLPPQGAHALASDLPGGEFANVFEATVAALKSSNNPVNVTLGKNLEWTISKGTRGIKPVLESTLYSDYGAVMRYDFGGPHEAYLNIQQLYGRAYRWSTVSNGNLIYSAKGKRQSWNEAETNGDSLNVELLSDFVPAGSTASLGDRPVEGVLYDFDFAQYYRAEGKSAPYLGRGVMMVRDDFLSIYDEMTDQAAGTFHWNNSGYKHTGELPYLYPVKAGTGSQMHLVAPKGVGSGTVTGSTYGSGPLSVVSAVYGAIVNGNEYVFMAGKNEAQLDVTGPNFLFIGKVGYASWQAMALFEGKKIGLGGFILERIQGDFGFSAQKVSRGQMKGRIAGKSGGSLRISLPADFYLNGLSVTIDGAAVPFTVSGRNVYFDVSISQPDGYKSYVITSQPD
ncbi:Ig-like domain-containing protein [Paenibacillus puerhi]|uniref:Ig-like domain-containing protein n=1 Tax=Paenibacillus puerhi TaxID=2692622 RepID=UPI00135779D9|nr:Ig-like domain-containing protein [Paenibacillus puerhi]